jgi:hypothetical protein
MNRRNYTSHKRYDQGHDSIVSRGRAWHTVSARWRAREQSLNYLKGENSVKKHVWARSWELSSNWLRSSEWAREICERVLGKRTFVSWDILYINTTRIQHSPKVQTLKIYTLISRRMRARWRRAAATSIALIIVSTSARLVVEVKAYSTKLSHWLAPIG